MDAINGLLNNLLTMGWGIAVAGAAFFLMAGAFIYMTAAGNPRQMEKGKSAMVNAIAGLVLVFSARAIATLIQNALPH
ncbi:MAG: pilin [Chloroflexota bacterium]